MRALIVVDVQNDFLPGGALAVSGGDVVIAPINRLMAAAGVLSLATQDWHPADHGSFAANHPGTEPGQCIELDGLSQVLWPVHCVQGSEGALFPDALETDRIAAVFQKGGDPLVDSYSGFYDNGRRHSTGLAEDLRCRGIEEVWVAGLATDYCVKYTALDALAEGFRTTLVADACRGVELAAGDCARAQKEILSAGGRLANSADLLKDA